MRRKNGNARNNTPSFPSQRPWLFPSIERGQQRKFFHRFGTGNAISGEGGHSSRRLDLTIENGHTLTADVVIWVTGASPPAMLQQISLPTAKSGFLRVHNTLQSVGNESIFVVGDSAEIDSEGIDRAGVYAVRQGPILWQNLNRRLSGRELVAYKPQRDFLRLLATGDGRAIAQWKWLSGIGAHWWRLKDRIDSKFMHMHRPSGSMKPQTSMSSPATLVPNASPTSDSPVMRCRGCGGKTSARVDRVSNSG